MRLTEKLIGYLNRVFQRGPSAALALRLRYAGTAMTWSISDGLLSTSVVGGAGSDISVDLTKHTVGTLASALAASDGYSVPYLSPGLAGLSALVLLDGDGDQDKSNGDHLNAHTSVLWSYMSAQAYELTLAKAAITEAVRQMAASTAANEWVDEHGTFYGVGRMDGESDLAYATRMVGEIGRARGNGVAIAEAVRIGTAADIVTVSDVDTPTTATAIDPGRQSYGLFDVLVEVGLDSPLQQAQVETNARLLIEAMRDAGTHLRKLRFARRSLLTCYVGAQVRSGHEVYILGDYPSVLAGEFTLNGARSLNGMLPQYPSILVGAFDLDGSRNLDGQL